MVSVKNLSAASLDFIYNRALAPKVDGNASDDQYNEYGTGFFNYGTTGIAVDGSAGPGTQLLTFSEATNAGMRNVRVFTDPLADWLTGTSSTSAPCFGGSTPDAPGYASGGNRVFVGATNASAALAPGATAKATYDIRML